MPPIARPAATAGLFAPALADYVPGIQLVPATALGDPRPSGPWGVAASAALPTMHAPAPPHPQVPQPLVPLPGWPAAAAGLFAPAFTEYTPGTRQVPTAALGDPRLPKPRDVAAAAPMPIMRATVHVPYVPYVPPLPDVAAHHRRAAPFAARAPVLAAGPAAPSAAPAAGHYMPPPPPPPPPLATMPWPGPQPPATPPTQPAYRATVSAGAPTAGRKCPAGVTGLYPLLDRLRAAHPAPPGGAGVGYYSQFPDAHRLIDPLPGVLERLHKVGSDASAVAVPANTLAGERTAWNHWRNFMTFVMRGSPEVAVRGRAPTAEDIEHDRRIVKLWITWLVHDKGVKPVAVVVYAYNLRRYFNREYAYLLGGSTAKVEGTATQRSWLGEHLHSLSVDHMLRYGVHVPDKKAPITLAHFVHWLSCVREGDLDAITVLAALATAYQLLLRVAEFSRPPKVPADGFNPNVHMTRASITWHSEENGPALVPSAVGLAGLKTGDYCLVRLGPSKADQLGQKYTSQPVVLPYSSDAPVNAARELAGMERAKPLLAPARSRTPLFTTGSGKWLTRDVLQSYMTKWGASAPWLPSCTGRSARIGGLCALIEAGSSPAECQRLGRWSSDAFRDYARAAPKGTEAARRLDIGRTMVKSVTQGHLPVCFHGNGPLLPLDGP